MKLVNEKVKKILKLTLEGRFMLDNEVKLASEATEPAGFLPTEFLVPTAPLLMRAI